MNLFTELEEKEDTKTEKTNSELLENLDSLRRLALFRDIPLEIIRLFAYFAKRKTVLKDSFIFNQDDMARYACLILDGEVQLFIEKSGKVVNLQRAKRSVFFGYMALLADFKWPFCARAYSDTELLIIDRESFRKILIQFPETGIIIVERLVQMRMKHINTHIRVLIDSIHDESETNALLKADWDWS